MTQRFLPGGLLFAIFMLMPVTAAASGDYLDYLFRSPTITDPGLANQFQQFIANVDNRQYLSADGQMDKLLAEPALAGVTPTTHAELLTDAGILKAVTNQDSQALNLLGQSVSLLEESVERYSPQQFNALMVSGMIKARARDYPAAVEFYRRAQHVLHLQDGVYTRKQIPVLDQLTNLDQARGTLLLSDVEQTFKLRIAERAYGANSEALIPTLESVAHYFAIRGKGLPRFIIDYDIQVPYLQGKVPSEIVDRTNAASSLDRRNSGPSIADQDLWTRSTSTYGDSQIRIYRGGLFDYAVELYQRAITILEKKYGKNDVRLAQPLQSLSWTRLVEGNHKGAAKQALERATSIIVDSPVTDVEDHVLALVHLGDLYIITNDRRAGAKYHEAWLILSQHPEMKKLGAQLFANPVRLYPEPFNYVLTRRPEKAGDDQALFAKLRFTVDKAGVPRDVHAVAGNISFSDQGNLATGFGSSTRYRPRLVGGYPVATPDVTYTQSFVVLESQVSKSGPEKKAAKPDTKSAESNGGNSGSGTGA